MMTNFERFLAKNKVTHIFERRQMRQSLSKYKIIPDRCIFFSMIDTATIANGTRQWYCRSIVPLGDILKRCNVMRGATISVPDFECLYLFTNFKNNQWNYTEMNSRQIHFLHPMQQLNYEKLNPNRHRYCPSPVSYNDIVVWGVMSISVTHLKYLYVISTTDM